MEYTYLQEEEFENRTGLSDHMKAYAEQQIQNGETLVFRSAHQDKNNKHIYTAKYDVLNSSGEPIYRITVMLDAQTNDYSSAKSRIL